MSDEYNRQRMKEQERAQRRAARCRHFNGIQHDRCDAGICYLTFNGGMLTGMALKLPCHGPLGWGGTRDDPQTCEKYSPLTPEEIAEEDREIGAMIERMSTIRAAIILDCGGKPKARSIPCPCCKGTVHYSVASNGHIHAACSTDGCSSWME